MFTGGNTLNNNMSLSMHIQTHTNRDSEKLYKSTPPPLPCCSNTCNSFDYYCVIRTRTNKAKPYGSTNNVP